MPATDTAGVAALISTLVSKREPTNGESEREREEKNRGERQREIARGGYLDSPDEYEAGKPSGLDFDATRFPKPAARR